MEQLADLAVVNERLAGGDAPAARARVEFLRGRRSLWAAVYDTLTRADAAATLESIEDATARVRAALAGGGGDAGELRARLAALRSDLASAADRLSVSRARLEHNAGRLATLKAEQAALEAALARGALEGGGGRAAAPCPAAPSPALWLPAAFAAALPPDGMLAVDVAGDPWVFWRDAGGGVAALRDECAHRACPLSLGSLDAARRPVCPYHGWTYDARGECVRQPSTVPLPGASVAAAAARVADGVVWLWSGGPPPGPDDPPLPPPPATGATPPGYRVVAEATALCAAPAAAVLARAAAGATALAWPDELASPAARALLGGVARAPPEALGGAPHAVATLAGAAGGARAARPLRLLHMATPSRDGGCTLLLRIAADGAWAAGGGGRPRAGAALAADAAAADAAAAEAAVIAAGGEGV
jgi:nitrite reductase/ring-hydroxylating ferredoxin subunit